MDFSYSCLKQCSLFVNLIDEHLAQLNLKLINKDYKRGQKIITPAEDLQDLFIIRKGVLKLYTVKNGKESILQFLKTGDVFGSFVNKHTNQLVYAEALEKSNVCKLRHEVLIELLQKFPELSTLIIEDLSRRLNEAQTRITNLTTGNAEDTVLNELKRLCKSFGYVEDGNYVLKMKISHQQLSEFVGLTRESVSHSIKKLTQKGKLKKSRDMLIIFT